DGTWLGHADILRRVEVPSNLGEWSYEVEDTKLARSEKPYFLVQLCFYSACVAEIQGRMPEHMYVVLGDGRRTAFRVSEFAPYERALKRRLERRIFHSNGTATYPYPCSHCNLCPWNGRCVEQRRRDDSPILVAGLSRLQDRRLRSGGILTLEALAQPDVERPADIKSTTFEKLRRQARLQFDQRVALAKGLPDPYRYELLPPAAPEEPPRGLTLLPKPSPGDVFFDMEGDPYYDVAEGLEYLFGAYTHDLGFRAFWGCDRGEGRWNDRLAEKKAFEALVDFLMARRAEDAGMHVYHYANYEKRSLKELAQRHATRENEIDTLLREERLVDLYKVVRQSVVVGQPGYGLKAMEVFFGRRDAAEITGGQDAVVEFERWKLLRDDVSARPANDGILEAIERYNMEDCVATARLLEWLLERRNEAARSFDVTLPFFTGTKLADEDRRPPHDPYVDLKARLESSVPQDFDPDMPGAESQRPWPFFLARQLLEYHWREDKPVWWALYDRCETYAEDPNDLLDDGEVIVGLTPVGQPEIEHRSTVHTFSFPPQEIKFDGKRVFDPARRDKAGEAHISEAPGGGGTVRLKRGPSLQKEPLPDAIIAHQTFPSAPLQSALARFSEALLDGAPASGRYRAASDVLLARLPRFRSRALGVPLQPEVVDADAIVALTKDLDDCYLFVQGPPGSGKTYQAARAIVRLLRDGYKVGATAFSHKAINNLLTAVERAALDEGVRFRGQRKVKEDDAEQCYESPFGLVTCIDNVREFSLGAGQLFAGTVWAFAPEAMDAQLDVLVIDEAGQLSLPNALAAMVSARSVLLLGDPLQLPHVHHTSHPANVGASVMEHLLGGELRVVPKDRGVLLDRTFRMHPEVCSFVSDLMYEGRLKAIPSCALQRIDSPGLSGTGVRYLPIDHSGCRVRSEEEARRIADEVFFLLQGTVTDVSGRRRAMLPSDIIVVTPYNSQRRCIEAELKRRGDGCDAVRVGTVDKFQGQEAYAVFLSTANSSPDHAVRGIDFIFDRNRLNVAISRARALAVYVGSPALLEAVPTSIDRMRALAAGCALVEYGEQPVPQRQTAAIGTQELLTSTAPLEAAL
ncbi:MAG: TM0106 family RecB-like putative nuclease, partial [Candidatus Eremiobacteraeota bacterium]|nr:TM0106 family RecB-like putative nuclease [Candidatus Eremiobacteraeota bacterium]